MFGAEFEGRCCEAKYGARAILGGIGVFTKRTWLARPVRARVRIRKNEANLAAARSGWIGVVLRGFDVSMT
jgi:hypothetical protein